MGNSRATPAEHAATRSARRLVGPRPGLLIAFASLVAAILAAFAYVVVDSQAKSRREAEKRFGAEATISAELTSSIFTASVASAQQAAAKAFGGRTIDERAVTALAARSRLAYALILGSDGKLIAASPGAPAVTGRAAAHIRAALAGRPELSDVLPGKAGKGPVIEWAIPFQTPVGRRVEVEGFPAGLLSKFLGSYLGRTRSDGSGQGFVLDSRGQIVGVSSGTAKAGDRPEAPGLLAALA